MSQTGPVIFNGRYELHRRLGRGGMAEVYLARDQMLDRAVAVKVLFPALATDPGFVERFRREAQSAANLNHPNIVGVYDWGEANGTYFIVMEYVEGESLAEIIHSEGRLHPDRAAEVASDVGAALGFAHRNGVIHRDVKPGNVLITKDGAVKVADFGIARAISDSSDQNLTKTGSVMGTATYFSPEQARGAAVDPRSDVYSLGCVLYEMITGRPPFSGENAVAIAYKHVQEAPVPPRQIDSALPETLEAIILKCLAKNPANRYPSAQDVRADLRRYLDGARIMAEPVMAPVGDPGATGVMAPTGYVEPSPTAAQTRYNNGYGGDDYDNYDDYDDEPKRSKSFLIVLVLLILVLAGLLFFVARSLSGDGGKGDQVTVPNVVGLPQSEAEANLKDAKLEPQVKMEKSDKEAGTVTRQDPPANKSADENSTVTIWVSQGPGQFAIPDVKGKTYDEAKKILEESDGKFLALRKDEASSDVEKDRVIRTEPPAGTNSDEGAEITVVVSTGPEQATVPNLANMTVQQATDALTQAGLTLGTQTPEASDTVPNGSVIRSDPASGTAVPKNSAVNIVVSSGADQVQVPGVEGLTEQNARQQIENVGLKVQISYQSDPINDGLVIRQSPQAGSSAKRGDTVSIVVGRFGGGGTTTTTSTTLPIPG